MAPAGVKPAMFAIGKPVCFKMSRSDNSGGSG